MNIISVNDSDLNIDFEKDEYTINGMLYKYPIITSIDNKIHYMVTKKGAYNNINEYIENNIIVVDFYFKFNLSGHLYRYRKSVEFSKYKNKQKWYRKFFFKEKTEAYKYLNQCYENITSPDLNIYPELKQTYNEVKKQHEIFLNYFNKKN